MEDELAVTNSIRGLSPQIVAFHGPTGIGKATVFPLAVAHWTYRIAGIKPGLTVCAQPRRILARELCNRVRENRRMKQVDKAVGYRIAREAIKDDSTKILYCTEAVVALTMQSCLQVRALSQARGDHHSRN